jgi:hypothetical protein
MLPIINAEDDFLTIVAAEENIAASEARKKKDFEEAHTKLKGTLFWLQRLAKNLFEPTALSKLLEAARISSTRPGSVPSEHAHLSNLNELDSSRLSLAKAISDAETVLGSKEAELAALKDEVRRLEGYDPALEHEKDLDSSAWVLILLCLLCADSLLLSYFIDYDWLFTKGSGSNQSLIEMSDLPECSFVRTTSHSLSLERNL